jgi:hypothetical protein
VIITIIFIAWVFCALINYRAMVTYFQTEYAPIADETLTYDRIFAAFGSLLGPVALLVTAIVCGGFRHGFSKW